MAITNGLKITQLDTALEFQDTDFFAVARGNKTYKLQGNSVIGKIVSTARFEALIPASTSGSVDMVHNLNSLTVNVTVYEIGGIAPDFTYEVVFPTVTIINANTVRLTFKTPPTTGKYSVLITK